MNDLLGKKSAPLFKRSFDAKAEQADCWRELQRLQEAKQQIEQLG
jgi:hypothetical protein